MLKVNNFQSLRGGDFSNYTSPDLEVLPVDVEQGFAGSLEISWDGSLDSQTTWDYVDESELF